MDCEYGGKAEKHKLGKLEISKPRNEKNYETFKLVNPEMRKLGNHKINKPQIAENRKPKN